MKINCQSKYMGKYKLKMAIQNNNSKMPCKLKCK